MAYKNGVNGFCALKNPNRPWYGERRTKTCGICLHETEGLADYDAPDYSAESTANYLATCDRASVHIVLDSDSTIDLLPLDYKPWAQGVAGRDYNNALIAIEIGTKGTDWTKKPAAWVEKVLDRLADVVAELCIMYNIPVRLERSSARIDTAIAANRKFGLCYHGDLSWDRSDPGLIGSHGTDTFPIARLLAKVTQRMGGEISTDQVVRPPAGDTKVTRVLRHGDTGADVKALQRNLNRIFPTYSKLAIDGSYGPATMAVVTEFQRRAKKDGRYGSTVDGICGPMTQAALRSYGATI